MKIEEQKKALKESLDSLEQTKQAILKKLEELEKSKFNEPFQAEKNYFMFQCKVEDGNCSKEVAEEAINAR